MNTIKAFGLALVSVATISTAAQADVFVLGTSNSAQKISYDATRQVRICNDAGNATRTLKIEHGLGTNLVEPGSCYTFESAEFRVSAQGIKSDYQIVGRVQNAN